MPSAAPATEALNLFDQPYVAAPHTSDRPDSNQTLDLYVPSGAGPFPLIVWIHGGGWNGCGKQPEGGRIAAQARSLGFAVASLNYRHACEAPFPAQIEDCHLALAWLRAHASNLRLDPDRIGVVGHSAGGHLCALLATGGIVESAQPVQGAVCLSPPCDLDRERGEWPSNFFIWDPADQFSTAFFPGRVYDTAFARMASPASHAHAGMPPVLLVHGGSDNIVPAAQTAVFDRALRALGVDSTLIIEPAADHSFPVHWITDLPLEFFGRVLMNDHATSPR